LGEFRQIGRIKAYWANFGLLGEFWPIGRILAYWANFGLFGEFRQIGRLFFGVAFMKVTGVAQNFGLLISVF
jgi:hypothetical protein